MNTIKESMLFLLGVGGGIPQFYADEVSRAPKMDGRQWT